VTIKELDTLLSLLADKKRKMEQEEAERNMQILLDFLHCLRKQKVDELKEVCWLQSLSTLNYCLVANIFQFYFFGCSSWPLFYHRFLLHLSLFIETIGV